MVLDQKFESNVWTESLNQNFWLFRLKMIFFFKNLSKNHLTQKEIDGLEKMRSLLFHHSWKNEAASLASDIKLDKNIIYSIKSTEESGYKMTSSTPDHVRRALIDLDIPTKDIKLRIYSDFLNIFREEFEHRFFKK